MLKFKCARCDQWHDGVPSIHFGAPVHIEAMSPEQRIARCRMESDACVFDGSEYFVRACLEIPVHGWLDPFVWGVWVSLSEKSFDQFCDYFEVDRRSHIGPFFGWLTSRLPLYPETIALKTRINLCDNRIRPWVELEPTDHPLAVEQRDGMTPERVAEICAFCEHHWQTQPMEPSQQATSS